MKSFAVFALVLLLAPAALCQHQTFEINPNASEVKMTLKTTHELVSGTNQLDGLGLTAAHRDGRFRVAIAGSGRRAMTVAIRRRTRTSLRSNSTQLSRLSRNPMPAPSFRQET